MIEDCASCSTANSYAPVDSNISRTRKPTGHPLKVRKRVSNRSSLKISKIRYSFIEVLYNIDRYSKMLYFDIFSRILPC